jgi:hypothetical protein
MSEAKPELDGVTAHQLETVQAWLREYGRRSVPVLVGPAPDPADFEEGEEVVDDRDVEFTHDGPWLSGKEGDQARRALIRVGINWRVLDLDKVEVHPKVNAEAGLGPVPMVELDFPPPDCTYCEIGLTHDGDSWYCEQCSASWDSGGFSSHTRKCVEPECGGNEAELVGDDGQPRCRPCQFLVAIGEIEATAPYKCRESYCGTRVVGMPADNLAARHQRCGRHQYQIDSDAYWKDYLDKKKTVTTAESL